MLAIKLTPENYERIKEKYPDINQKLTLLQLVELESSPDNPTFVIHKYETANGYVFETFLFMHLDTLKRVFRYNMSETDWFEITRK